MKIRTKEEMDELLNRHVLVGNVTIILVWKSQ